METKGKSPTSQGLILENLEMDGTSIQKNGLLLENPKYIVAGLKDT
jgi:hypothetical protein